MRRRWPWVVALRKEFSKTKPDGLRLAMTELLSSLSPDGKISEAAFENHLDFLVNAAGLIKSKPSATEGVLWTNKYHQ